MLLKPCRRCGALPEILFTRGRDYGWSKEDKAQAKCFSCGAVGRPIWGDPSADPQIIMDLAAMHWNREQFRR